MKNTLSAIALMALATPAFAANNACQEAAKQAVSKKFHVTAEMNQDERQPNGSGTYQLLIFKNDCWYDVSVKMLESTDGSCQPSAAPDLDEGSANCG